MEHITFELTDINQTIPDETTRLICDFNADKLPEIKHLVNLKIFVCDDCAIRELPELPVLPQGLTTLDCFQNQLTILPELPEGLTTLGFHNNQLTKFPVLPERLTIINCASNQLTILPDLTEYSKLEQLNCYGNKLNPRVEQIFNLGFNLQKTIQMLDDEYLLERNQRYVLK